MGFRKGLMDLRKASRRQTKQKESAKAQGRIGGVGESVCVRAHLFWTEVRDEVEREEDWRWSMSGGWKTSWMGGRREFEGGVDYGRDGGLGGGGHAAEGV